MKPKEKKLVVMNVIGGLEKKEVLKYLSVGTIEEGHNQLCNREVIFDRGLIDKMITNSGTPCKPETHFAIILTNRNITNLIEDIFQAISQGKIIKVKR